MSKRKKAEKTAQETPTPTRHTPSRHAKSKKGKKEEEEEEEKPITATRKRKQKPEPEQGPFEAEMMDLIKSYQVAIDTQSKHQVLSQIETRVESQAKELTDQYQTSDLFIRLLVLETKAMQFTVPARPEDHPIYYVTPSDPIPAVWKALVDRKFLSAPILVEVGDRKFYIGFIDMMDIVIFVMRTFQVQAQAWMDLKTTNIWDQAAFRGKTVGDVSNFTLNQRNPFHPIKSHYSAMAVFEPLARETGVQRLAVVDVNDTTKLVNMVTQSQVVKFLRENLQKLGSKRFKPIGDCVHSKFVRTVSKDNLALDAFNAMTNENISGVAYVNEEGTLLDTLSVRDLKVIGHETGLFWRLGLRVDAFVDFLRTEWQQRHRRARVPITVTQRDSLEKVITLLAQHEIHRVFIVDAKFRPQGVVSLKDVLSEIINGHIDLKIPVEISPIPSSQVATISTVASKTEESVPRIEGVSSSSTETQAADTRIGATGIRSQSQSREVVG